MTKIAACPYCGIVLEKAPSRKKPCPECSKDIFVRSGKLVTEDRAREIDAIRKLEAYEITEEQFLKVRQDKSTKYRTLVSVNDTVWSIYNQLVYEAMKESAFHQLSMLYFDMALILISEGRSGFLELQKQSHKMKLLDYKSDGLTKQVTITNTNDDLVCETCRQHEGKTYNLEDAIREGVLPISGCSHKFDDKTFGYCRCWYIPVIEDY